MKNLFILAALTGFALANTNADDVDGVFGDADQWKTGYVSVDEDGDDLFYWVFQSRNAPETDPLVMWLTGGPGCASEVALFYENGPYQFNDDMTLRSNPNSWNNIANLLYVDQPIGTGFSHGGKHDVRNEKEVAEDAAILLRGFLEQNPEYKGRDFFITGESYAGHYVPAIAYYLLNEATDVDLNLKSIAIGNGLTDPFHQYPAYAPFSYENGLIGKEKFLVLEGGFKACQALIYESESGPEAGVKLEVAALEFCSLLMETIIGNPAKFNSYDIRIPCEKPPLCYDFSQSDTLLNQESVQKILGVPVGTKWEECDMAVHEYLTGDWMLNLMPQVADMLDNSGIDVLVYSGDKDFVVNWRGGEAWSLATKWAHKEEFNAAEVQTWSVNGEPAGEMRQYENFHFLRVYDAGHMVPMDQPVNALSMLQRFISNDWDLSKTTEFLQ
jgi:cathepsin A (carboxypeptidase C)